jgi:26S proteasome regulatory subunit T4
MPDSSMLHEHLLIISLSGLFAIKAYRDAVNQDDFNKAVRKMAEAKKLEGKLEYQKL